MTTPYEVARQVYWDAQHAFRLTAIEEVKRLMPDGAERVVFDMTDGIPQCLTLIDVLDADGESMLDTETIIGGDESLYDRFNQIGMDMEFADYDEARGYLPRTDNGTFYIKRPAQEAPQEARDTASGDENPTAGTGAGNLPSLLHQARNILWSADNGGHDGRPSEVKRILAAICDESERLWGAS